MGRFSPTALFEFKKDAIQNHPAYICNVYYMMSIQAYWQLKERLKVRYYAHFQVHTRKLLHASQPVGNTAHWSVSATVRLFRPGNMS